MLQIRFATKEDLPRIDELFDGAREFMAKNGNPTQWTNGFPNSTTVEPFIAKGEAYVCFDDEKDNKVMAVYVLSSVEPAYDQDTVTWNSNQPFVVIHRLASESGSGAGTFIFKKVMADHPYVRIDTHEDNKPMLHLMDKLGFMYTGKVFYDRAGGGWRVCYDYVRPN